VKPLFSFFCASHAASLPVSPPYLALAMGFGGGAFSLFLVESLYYFLWHTHTPLELAFVIILFGSLSGAAFAWQWLTRRLENAAVQYVSTLLEQSPDGIGLCEQNRLVWLNHTALRLFGIDGAHAYQDKALSDFVYPGNHDLLKGFCQQIAQGIYQPAWIGIELQRPDHSRLEVRLHLAPFHLSTTRKLLKLVVRDLADYKAVDEKLRQAARVFDAIHEGIMITDVHNSIVRVNPAFTRITGYQEHEVLGQAPTFLRSSRHQEDFYRAMSQTLKDTGEWEGELWNRRKDGEIYPQWGHISTIKNAHGEISHYIQVFSDVTRLRQSEAKLEYLTHHDTLTGLPNRLLLMARFKHSLERLARQPLKQRMAILWIDIDRFRHINKTLGHARGDKLLRHAARRLEETVSQCQREATLARMGADEFAVLIEDLPDSQYAAVLAQRILDRFNAPLLLDDLDIALSAGIGISFYPEDGETCETLLYAADAALSRVKEQGGRGYQCFTLDMNTGMHDAIVLGNHLARALERQEFVLYYQPQVDIKTRQIIGAEAVLRWQHPERGLLAPNKFIPYAEETGLITGISEWALRTACLQNKQWQAHGLPPIRMGVNLTARQIAEEHTIEKITAALHESRLAPQWLKLEVTESLIIANPEQAILNMNALKHLGVKLSIDDFGTGYSSFSYLKQLPVDELKIDREFIKDIPHNAHDCKITPAMIAIGHSLQLNVVAEGVETEAQLAFLDECQCDIIQGFLFSPPVPADEFVTLFKANFWQPV
jgi:diguanylate cyclase (GGDEF)-like protein/PAS domain S-box-containing protein